MGRLGATLLALGAGLAACSSTPRTPAPQDDAASTIILESSVFRQGGRLPPRFTCEGDDVSPPLSWQGLPENTIEVAIVMEDPDAPGGSFAHWAIWALDPGRDALAAGEVPAGARLAANDFGRIGYGGPCPPKNEVHDYVFTLYALRARLPVSAGEPVDDVTKAAAGRTIATGRLTGNYNRV